jgi:hypothetical protein
MFARRTQAKDSERRRINEIGGDRSIAVQMLVTVTFVVRQ